ncbi:MAG: tetraacyldisaccharide 4'-kinase, partial [Deltaproteobacteria bacterium]|nr:tetraacyldisaccharide 4'-kinase [Deltaproteobacteria bacterium]
GNVTVGGNLKTPLAAWLARALAARGLKPAILSRGYGRRRVFFSREPVLVSCGRGPLASAEIAGDEPYLLAIKTPAFVVVADQRTRAARLAQSLGAEILILDDGFQHLPLARDVDILSLAGTEPFGNGLPLPAGPLRERLSVGSLANLAVATPDCPPNPWGLPQFVAKLELTGLKTLYSGRAVDLTEAKGLRLAAFCGLAKPDEFKKSLKAWGLNPIVFRSFPDHARYGRERIKELAELLRFSRSDWLLTTPKDAVKLQGLNLPVLVAETALAPDRPKELLDLLFSLLRAKGHRLG